MLRGSQKIRLSVAIIARDAQDTIGQSIASVRAIANELMVIDTGSTDDTRRVAVEAGAKVIGRTWDHDFSAARNYAWSQVRGDWVLWLDANETLPSSQTKDLREFIDRQAQPTKAYSLLVHLPVTAGATSGEQVARVRLAPNRSDLRFVGRVREQLQPALDKAGVEVQPLPWTIVRNPRDNDPQVKAHKARRDLQLIEMEIKSRGQQADLLVALGETLSNLGENSGAAAAYRTALEKCPPQSTLMREAYYGLLTNLDGNVAAQNEQIAICLEALTQFPLDAQLLCAMGGYLQAQDRLDLAARAYQTALEHGEIDPNVWHASDISEIAAVCLALVHQLRDDDALAQQILEAAIARSGAAKRARRHLIELHVKHDRRKAALDEVERLPGETPHREALRSAVRGACLANRKNWIPALAYLQTAYSAGCRDPLCLRWLSVSLIASGEIETATPILDEWHALEPRNVEAQKYRAALAAGTLHAELVETAKPSGLVLRLDPAAPSLVPPPAAPVASIGADEARQTIARANP